MLSALVISNGIGTAEAYRSNADIRYDVAEVGPGFRPALDRDDVLLVPNGADHVAMLSIRDDVRAFLERGGALFCFCGWFTNWIPGNRWVHDNRHPTREVRHRVGTDRHGLFAGVDLARFDHNRHGISGWSRGSAMPYRPVLSRSTRPITAWRQSEPSHGRSGRHRFPAPRGRHE